LRLGDKVAKNTSEFIVETMENWQKGNDKLVSVRHFTLQPQSQGFVLSIDIYVADNYNPEYGYDEYTFFGSLEECFEQALEFIEIETKRLKKLL
jgi:hypothetical protein